MPRKKKVLPVEPPQPPVVVTHSQDSHAGFFLMLSIFVKATAIALTLVIVPLVLFALIFAYSYLHTLSVHAGIPLATLYSEVRTGWRQPVVSTDNRRNLLILGVDTLSLRPEDLINTDTMMVASINLKTAVVTTFSIPRDLFVTSLKLKINAVYGTAIKNKQPPIRAAQTAVQDLVGIPIHNTLVLEIEEVGKIIDTLGGIDLTVDRSFTDTQFPREGVDVTQVKDPNILYETVSFAAGPAHMDGKTALQFIRSRHSKDPIEGSDDARSLRQQKVIEALVSKLSNTKLARNPAYVGDLLKLYSQDFDQYLPFTDVVGIGKLLLTDRQFPRFQSQHFAIKGFDTDPVLYHPDRFYTGQWVYLPIDPTGVLMKTTVANWLK